MTILLAIALLEGVYIRPEMKNTRNEILFRHEKNPFHITFHCGQNEIVTHCGIWHHLYNLKNVKNTHGGVLLLVKLKAKVSKWSQ